MSSEQNMRKKVVKALRPLHAVSVENGVGGAGTPDVNYAGGWIELKSVAAWPKRADTILRVEHFNPAQKIWLTKRCEAGGVADLLLKVGNDWLLFEGGVATAFVGKSTKESLLLWADWVWYDGLDEEEFRQVIRDRRCSRKT